MPKSMSLPRPWRQHHICGLDIAVDDAIWCGNFKPPRAPAEMLVTAGSTGSGPSFSRCLQGYAIDELHQPSGVGFSTRTARNGSDAWLGCTRPRLHLDLAQETVRPSVGLRR